MIERKVCIHTCTHTCQCIATHRTTPCDMEQSLLTYTSMHEVATLHYPDRIMLRHTTMDTRPSGTSVRTTRRLRPRAQNGGGAGAGVLATTAHISSQCRHGPCMYACERACDTRPCCTNVNRRCRWVAQSRPRASPLPIANGQPPQIGTQLWRGHMCVGGASTTDEPERRGGEAKGWWSKPYKGQKACKGPWRYGGSESGVAWR